jgi:hypothetical protein
LLVRKGDPAHLEFLVAEAARARATEVSPFRCLIANRALVRRPGSAQWRFLSACRDHLLVRDPASGFVNLSAARAAQLKLEVENRLRRHYLQQGGPQGLVFAFVHRSEMGEYRVPGSHTYPSVAGDEDLLRRLQARIDSAARGTRLNRRIPTL